ncbi:MAG: GTPase Era [Acidimicrobiia bacterium]|nr:GTPase Era [Acidimicrobiia bacterium]
MSSEGGLRSGFVTLVGRPNVGKSTLLNWLCGTKVSIVSDKPQTTRRAVHGVLHRDGVQVVFVDTPGIGKPRTALGARLNATAAEALRDVDVACLIVDATAPFGPGDRFVAGKLPADGVVVVNKIDAAAPARVLEQLAKVSQVSAEAYFPLSARTGEGVEAFVDHLLGRMPPGPPYYPEGMVSAIPDDVAVAELVREQLLAVVRDELPYAIATRVTQWEWPRIRCEILVERTSQRRIVIGHRGKVLKQVGTRVRRQLPPGAYLELHVSVDPNWQDRPAAVERYCE